MDLSRIESAGPLGSDVPDRVSAADVTMQSRVDAFDWSGTPLGPRERWPAELRVVVRQIMDSHFPKAIVWGAEGTTIHNDAFLPILGRKPDALGRSFKDIWAEAWDDIGPIAVRAYRGEATYIEDFPLVVERGGLPEQAWFTFCYSPLRLSDGSVVGMMDTVVETTATVRAREDAQLLSRELGHRLKNTLTLVQAIAAQSFREFSDTQAVQSFGERLSALGYAHDLLLRQDWSGSSLRDAAIESLRPHEGPGRLTFAGPDVRINSRATVTLAMILNELATNAVKYGALSVPGGAVEIAWSVEGETFVLDWRETGGPAACEPTVVGLGTRLIDRGFGFDSRVQRKFGDDGMHLTITSPVKHLVA